ncbi:MAG: hypothetical protein WBW47_04090 [Thermoplasmata archaeon]
MSTLVFPSPRNPRDGERFILELDRRLERFDRAILVADWNFQSGRSKVGTAPWQLKRAAFLSDERLLPWVRSARERSWPYPLTRRLELLERILLDTQVEQNPEVIRLRSTLQETVVAFRPRWKKKRAERAVLYKALEESPKEAERRAAYYAMEPLYRPIEESLRELVRLRNDRARALGYPSFAEMRLRFEGVSVRRLEELCDVVADTARPHLRALRDGFRERTGQSGWHPWDSSFARRHRVPLPARLFPQREMFPRIFRAIQQWGFRTDRMRFRVVYHDLPAGGITLAPDPPKDIRILVHRMGGFLPYCILFHEVGHAVHSASIRAPRHLLRWLENIPGVGGCDEGLAGLFEEIPNTAEWLETQPGVGVQRAREHAAAARDSNVLDAAWHASFLRIEQRLYQNPDRDPMPEAQRFERRLFGYDDYPTLSFAESFLVESPIYSANYLLAILFGRQLERSMREVCGEPYWPNRKVGPWLTRNWFVHGSLYDWVPHVKEVTGRPFGAEAFRESFAAA